jgi:hypothetical protein
MRRVKEFAEIRDYTSIDALIEQLTELRDTLPHEHEAELQLKGCDIFGRSLQIGYMRPQTAEEAAMERRYSKQPLRLAA